ncbi:MAG: trigger factor, partial [Actinobacteria bacterium]|nr:trigger factor [Actinomycetota bacterium]
MKSAVENLSASRVKVSIDLDYSELKPSLDAAYKRIASQVNIPGFRKGNVPARIIDQRFGKTAALDEAVNDAIPASLGEVIVENKLVQMSRPEVDVTTLDEETGLSFTAEFDIRPEFDLPTYSELKVIVDDPEVTDEAVEEQLNDLRARFGSLKTVERSANDGDIVVVDLRGSHNDVEVPDLSAQGLSYELGSKGMVDGFDDAVRGASADEVRNFVFTPTNGEWTGKAVVVEVTVRQVRERELPKADDTFAQLASEFDTIDELRSDLRERLGRMRLIEQAYQARDLAHDALMEAIKVEVPAGAIADEVSAHFHDGHGDDAHKEEFEQQARTGIKSRMILDKIAETEDLQVNDAEMTQWLIS